MTTSKEKTVSLTKWDHRFIAMAQLIGSWSKDTSTQVGCVLVDQKNRVISLGFNGSPHGVTDHHVTRDEKLARTIHAEVNSILFATRDVTGATAYVTHPPCSACAAVLVQKEIARVVFPKPSEDFLSRWKESYFTALGMFRDVGVEVVEVSQ